MYLESLTISITNPRNVNDQISLHLDPIQSLCHDYPIQDSVLDIYTYICVYIGIYTHAHIYVHTYTCAILRTRKSCVTMEGTTSRQPNLRPFDLLLCGNYETWIPRIICIKINAIYCESFKINAFDKISVCLDKFLYRFPLQKWIPWYNLKDAFATQISRMTHVTFLLSQFYLINYAINLCIF